MGTRVGVQLTGLGKPGMQRAMLAFARNPWPFGVNRERLPAFLAGVAGIFVVLLAIDGPVAHFVVLLPEALRAPFYVITRPGNPDWILYPSLFVALFLYLGARTILAEALRSRALHAAGLALFVFVGVAAPGIAANIVKRLLGRARPLEQATAGPFHFEPFNFDWHFQSFPSGDTTTMFAFAGVVMLVFPRLSAPALIAAALVGLARIMISMHFPSDVFGGIIFGLFGAFAVRNLYASRGWLFERDESGLYRLKNNAKSDFTSRRDNASDRRQDPPSDR